MEAPFFKTVIGVLMWAVTAVPVAAEAPVRLSDAELDRVAAGSIMVEAVALSAASGDQFTRTKTSTRTKVNAKGAVEVGIAIARADAMGCCQSSGASAATWAETDGDSVASHTHSINVTNGLLSRSQSFSVAVGVNRL